MAKVTITLDLECATQLRKQITESHQLYASVASDKGAHAEYVARGDKGRQEWADLLRTEKRLAAILEALA